MRISNSTHPDYTSLLEDWKKYRLVEEGGDAFVSAYLESYSDRESTTDFDTRRDITPVPGFAAGAVNDIKNSIYQRMSGITRDGGSEEYHKVMKGQEGGVDLLGSTINYFIGNNVLSELLFMGKVGIYVDMPNLMGMNTMSQTKDLHPYYYTYTAEDILNWRFSHHGSFLEFQALLLREKALTFDDFDLPSADYTRYRLLTVEDGQVMVRFYNDESEQIDINGDKDTEPVKLGIKRIPFVLVELNRSLLTDIANHQIALLNLESSDVAYSLKANFPFYVEQQDRLQSPHLKTDTSDGEDEHEVVVGGTTGRTYSKDTDRPEFIHPSSEPLMASMSKQKQLKEDIRTLVNLTLSSIQPKYASGTSKALDERGLESGLSFIGLIMEHAERQLASYFNEYEDSKEVVTIKYPEQYALKTDSDRLKEAQEAYDVMIKLPTEKAQREMLKQIARGLLESKISQEEMAEIIEQIETAEYLSSEPEVIHSDLEKGLLSTLTASKARGYNAKKEVPQAKLDHSERILRIKEAQSNDGARGVDDLDASPKESAQNEKVESQNADLQGDTKKPVRQEEK
jgi:hypothetical protein